MLQFCDGEGVIGCAALAAGGTQGRGRSLERRLYKQFNVCVGCVAGPPLDRDRDVLQAPLSPPSFVWDVLQAPLSPPFFVPPRARSCPLMPPPVQPPQAQGAVSRWPAHEAQQAQQAQEVEAPEPRAASWGVPRHMRQGLNAYDEYRMSELQKVDAPLDPPPGCLPWMPPLDALRMPSGCPPDALRMPSGCPLDALWMPSGCPLDALWMPSGCLTLALAGGVCCV